MNVTYIASSFHPNQAPIMKGWVENGDTVTFISQYLGPTEDHSYCVPHILGYSHVFLFMNSIYMFFQKRSKKRISYPEAFRNKCGFASYLKMKRLILNSKPDVVIVRERSINSMMAYYICKRNRIKCILYNQTPLWMETPTKKDILHRIVNAITPQIRMTPVLGDAHKGFLDEKGVYIPFVIEPHFPYEMKEFFEDSKINLLCVGKYEPRKHHLMLLEIVNKLKNDYPIHLTLVGEASIDLHQKYLEKVREYIEKNEMQEYVDVNVNKKTSEMAQFYKRADFFILPSTGEFASISQLEAMSYSLPVIVSDTNGTSCYVESGINGYLFEDNDAKSLEKCIIEVISDRNKLKKMGENSYRLVLEKYSFEQYRKRIVELI